MRKKCLVLFHYATYLARRRRGICLFVKRLDTDLNILLVHMALVIKIFNEVTHYVKKIRGVLHVG